MKGLSSMTTPTKPENPPAFPVFTEYEQWDDEAARYRSHILPDGGMSLRDYFAAKALVGILDSCMSVMQDGDEFSTRWHNATNTAQMAYEMADAMLAERSKP